MHYRFQATEQDDQHNVTWALDFLILREARIGVTRVAHSHGYEYDVFLSYSRANAHAAG